MVSERTRLAWWFTAPALLLIALVAGWPLMRTFYLGFTDYTLSDPEAARFVGVDNFARLMTDIEWWRSIGNTLVFAGISVGLETLFGIIVALVMNVDMPGRALVRTAILVPWAIPTVVSARMWAWMLNDNFGIVNELLIRAGLIDTRLAWLAQEDLSLFSVILVDVWKSTPFMALLILAALQGVPKNLYEVARLDGIPRWQFFFRVILPYLKPAILVAVIFRMLDALRVFDVVYVLTGNNPSTKTMSVYARERLLDFQQFGYGSAASFAVFCIIATITILYLRLNRGSLEVQR